MADDNQGAGSQAGQGDQSQADKDEKAQAAGKGGSDTSESISLEEAKKLRSEAANLRKRLKDNETELAKLKDADLSESQKLQKERDALKAERDQLVKDRRINLAQAAAAKAGAIHPDVVAKLLPEDALSDDDPKALEAAISKLRKDYQTLFRNPHGSADGGAGNGASGADASMNHLIRRAAGRA